MTVQPGGTETLEVSSIPVGVVQLELVNSGDIAIVGAASAVAGDGGLGGLTERSLMPGSRGSTRMSSPDRRRRSFHNNGTILIGAQADVVSAGVANGVALASGIDQAASAWAVGGMVVFPPGASTPSFTTFAYPVGPATVRSTMRAITVLASVDASGQTAFGGATAQGIGQSRAGDRHRPRQQRIADRRRPGREHGRQCVRARRRDRRRAGGKCDRATR